MTILIGQNTVDEINDELRQRRKCIKFTALCNHDLDAS